MKELTISKEKLNETLSKFSQTLSCYGLDKRQRIHIMLLFDELCLQILSNTQNSPTTIEYEITSTYGQVEIIFNIPKKANIDDVLYSSKGEAENLTYWKKLVSNIEKAPDISEKNNCYILKLKVKLQKKNFCLILSLHLAMQKTQKST